MNAMIESLMSLHRCEDCANPLPCGQEAEVDLRPNSPLAQALVAGLENLSERAGAHQVFACPAYGSLKSNR